MKKFVALLLAAMMVLGCAAALAEYDVSYDRTSHVTDWAGTWKLVAAYIGEDFADENDIKTVGEIELPEDNGVVMVLEAVLDNSANDKTLGTMVDVANYIHGHCHDLLGTLTLGGDDFSVKSAWDEWPNNVVRGENDGDFNYGPAKTHVKGIADAWADLTGVEIEDIEEMKFIGLNADGQLILCYSDDNVAKKDGDIAYALIFVKAE